MHYVTVTSQNGGMVFPSLYEISMQEILHYHDISNAVSRQHTYFLSEKFALVLDLSLSSTLKPFVRSTEAGLWYSNRSHAPGRGGVTLVKIS